MFSNDVNRRDLYFSNPVDHFFSQDNEIKTSIESGFSSSFNHTGNSKEMQYRSSQDLFNLSERSDSQYGIKNTDYKKYISENLLLGKKDKYSKSFLQDKKDDYREHRNDAHLSPRKEIDGNDVKEIRNSLNTLYDNLKRISTDIEYQSNTIDSLRDDISKVNEKLSTVENKIENKVEQIIEDHKSILKKEQIDNKSKNDKISKNAENIDYIVSKMEEYASQNDKKILESIKILKTYENNNEKQILNMKHFFSQLDGTVNKLNTFSDDLVKNIRSSIEIMFDGKFEKLKVYSNNPVQQMILPATNDRTNMSYLHKERNTSTHPTQYEVCPRDAFEIVKKSNDQPEQRTRQNSTITRGNSTSTSKHSQYTTPLKYYTGNYKNAENAQSSKQQLNVNSKYADKGYNSDLKIRRKPVTPRSPFQRVLQQKSNNVRCTPLTTTLRTGPYNQPYLQRNQVDFLRQRGYIKKEEMEPATPVLTVYEASTLAKQYIFQRQYTGEK